MKISLIVAMARNRTIAKNDQMPWHISADLKKFKQITMGNPIIMGRKTFESIGKALPGRTNIVISRNPLFQRNTCLIYNSLDSAFKACGKFEEVFIIGGGEIYELAMPQADNIYLTQIHKIIEGDTFFPKLDKDQWKEVSREEINDDKQVNFNYSFIKLERV